MPIQRARAAAVAAALAVSGTVWLAMDVLPVPAAARLAMPTASVSPAAVASATPEGTASGGAVTSTPAAGGPHVSVRPAVLPTPEPTRTPTRVRIDALQVDLPVEAVGVTGEGAMSIPRSAFVAGWYRHSARPGSPQGAQVIAAHVSSRVDGPGPLSRLERARPGQEIVVESDNGAARYVVESIQRVPKLRLDSDALFDRTGPHRLNLVTCGGRYDRAARSYEDNVVVVARPVG